MSLNRASLVHLTALLGTCSALSAVDPAPPVITDISTSGSTNRIRFTLYPAAQAYTILSGTNIDVLAPDPNFFIGSVSLTNFFTNSVGGSNVITTNVQAFYDWRQTNSTAPRSFYRIAVTPLGSNALLSATVLNRLTYGTTPDEIERINLIGPDAYIAEQLAPWVLAEDVAGTHTNVPFIEAKLASATNFVDPASANIADFRALHTLRAVNARRQLLEILLQFFENHFVTEYDKSRVYYGRFYNNGDIENRLATQLEYLENEKWRNALLNPQCSFHDLLKISAESPAMIIYLDTIDSRGNGSNIANENYARELLELFTFGVDNGYDQNDITVQSRIWTGWRIEKVDFSDAFNPFAVATTNIIPGSTNTSTTTKSNLFGVWAFNYKSSFHNTTPKTNFPGRLVPERYGPLYTGKTYGTNTTPGLYQLIVPGRSGTNGIQEGYEYIAHIADLPFTQEYISIKLCRLFVHDDFPNPKSDSNAVEYAFYNYAAGNLSPEADLVYRCMQAWETNSPKGQIWLVLKTIFDSDLFRSHVASLQKVKTPLEFVSSAVRALRCSTNGSNLAGSFTALTDGYAMATPLSRMGNMLLFDRDSPDGYPEAGPPWISAGTLAERVRYVQSFCIASGQSGHNGSQGGTGNDAQNSICSVVGLLQARLPAASWTNATDVANYIAGILYPGEGAGNLQFYRDAAVRFLESDDDGNPSAFAGLTVSGAAGSTYDTRVRGMVGMLMSTARFQEQ